jgi:hypothetical protein
MMISVCLMLYFNKREQQKLKKLIVFRLCWSSFQCKLWKYNQICLLTTQEVFFVMLYTQYTIRRYVHTTQISGSLYRCIFKSFADKVICREKQEGLAWPSLLAGAHTDFMLKMEDLGTSL